MLDLNNDITDFYNIRHELENNILQCVTDFVIEFGKKSEDKISFDLNPSELSEVLDMPQALIEVGRSTGEHNWETLQRLYVEKAGNNLVRLFYETESCKYSFCYLDTDSMIDVYSLIKSFLDGKLDDIEIKDYRFTVKE